MVYTVKAFECKKCVWSFQKKPQGLIDFLKRFVERSDWRVWNQRILNSFSFRRMFSEKCNIKMLCRSLMWSWPPC